MLPALIVVVLLIAVFWALASPWRRGKAGVHEPADERLRLAAADVEDLEAARDAKYREIRDAELDRQTGKLSDTDFAAVDGGLRAEAVEILRRLDRAEGRLKKLRAARAATEPELTSPAVGPREGVSDEIADAEISRVDAD